MRVILKPAGLILLLGALVVLTSLVIIKPQKAKLLESSESAPLDVFKSEKKANRGSASIFDGQDAVTQVNLSEVGTQDWVHWGLTGPKSVNRKAGGGNRISDFRLLNGDDGLITDGKRGPTRGISWTGGTPTSKETLTYSGIHVRKNGFAFHVPADSKPHTLRVYTGGLRAQGEFSAWLSGSPDAAKPKVAMQDTALANGYWTRIYTVDMPAAAGQTLNVTWRMKGDSGDKSNVSLQAAALD